MSSATTAPAAPPAKSAIWADVSLVSVAAIWGLNIPLMKLGLEHIDLYRFNAIRLTISAAVLVFFAWIQWREGVRPAADLRRRHVLVYGLIIGALYQLLFLQGIANTTPGNTALIIATVPMWTALLAWLFLREHLRPLAWFGLLLSLMGTIVVAVQKDVDTGQQYLWGNSIVLLAALTWAAGTVYSRPLLKKVSPAQLAAISSVIGLPFHYANAINVHGQLDVLQTLPTLGLMLWLIVIYSGSLSSGLSQPMWHFGVRHAGAAHAAVVQNLVPVFAMLAAWMIQSDQPSLPQIIGGSLILSGLALMRLTR